VGGEGRGVGMLHGKKRSEGSNGGGKLEQENNWYGKRKNCRRQKSKGIGQRK